MSTHPESSERPATSSTDLANLGAQLSEVLNRFNELSVEMMAQRHVIDQLVASGASGEQQHAPLPPGQSEPILLPYAQISVSSQAMNPPEETFTYPTHGPPPTYAPHIQTNPPQVQISQNYPPITVSMPFEPQGPHYYATAEPFTLDTAVQGKTEVGGSSVPVDKNLLKRLDRFEEFIRKSQGVSKQGGLDYNELCLFPDMQLPVGFKAPKFTKYDGTGNPKTHLRMFANKLGRPIDDENLPVRLFPESLEGDALDWYSNLKPEDMKSWMDLSTAFVRQYEYNCELAPTRTTLEGTKRKPSEDHKTYAKRWRKLAAKVEPPMTENEIVRTFIKAHDPPYFEEIFRMTGCSFAEIVNKLEEYDEFIRAGKIVNVSALKSQLEAMQSQSGSSKKAQFKKKDEEASFVWDQGFSSRPRYQQNPTYSPCYLYQPHPRPVYNTTINHPRPRPNYPNTPSTPFHVSPPNLQIRPRPPFNPRPIPSPNPNYQYQQTRDTQNPTPYRTFTNLGRPVDQLYEQLKAAGKIGTVPPKTYPRGFPPGYDPQSFCAYHSGSPGHPTANCWALKHKIQDMIDAGDIILRRKDEQGPSVSNNPFPQHKDTVGTITIEEGIEDPTQYIVDEAEIMGVIGEPFILEEEAYKVEENTDPFILEMIPFECEPSELVVLELPEQTPVLNLQEVPWNYSEPTLLIGERKVPKKEVDAITRSGRIIGEPAVDESSKAKEGATPTKPIVTDEEAFNFLKMLKKSEYKVVEQLDKMPAQISMLNLLLTSELHREALVKVLTEAQVPKNIPIDKFANVVEHVLASSRISFSDEDLTAEGIGHNKALYISVRCNGKLLPKVLIDNGSALNICPWNTLVKLGFQETKLRPSTTVVRGFDGAKSEPMGEVDLVIEIGPAQFQVMCQVMNFSSVYNILLGRPWIHTSGAIPSSLHQLLRFVVNDQLITVFAEDDCTMIVNSGPNEEDSKTSLLSSHHVADIVSVGWISKEKPVVEMNLPEASVMMAKEMIRGRYEMGKGLGRNLQGVLEPIELQGKKDTFGLGFQPTARDKKEMMNRKKAEKEGRQLIMNIPPLYCTFPYPSEVIKSEVDPIEEVEVGLSELFVGVISEREPLEDPGFPEVPIEAMKNWTQIQDESDNEEESESLLKDFEQYEEKSKPNLEETEAVNIGTETEVKEIKVSIHLNKKQRKEMIEFLTMFQDVFAWSYDDMPGISTDIVVHRLPTDPSFPPVKQKPRKFKPDMSLKIKEQIEKQLNARIIMVSHYPIWLSNPVPVPKKSGEVRVCVDYRDLNKASPKDDFPLPNIHILLDNTAGHEIESFADCFAGYHQILMAEEDREKTAFITPWGTFCYRVMPFGLKNAGATYQRTMTTLFHDMIHKEMEVYVDDIIIKSERTEDHLIDLGRLFERLRKYDLKLNPAKCAFGAPAGKLLGFIVSKKGIEIDPAKIKAIREMPVPRTQKDVKSFLGKINFIGRFIAQLTHTCEPLFKLLKKNVSLQWNEECQQAFDKIKDYLLHPPVLVPPKPGRPLIMYLSVLDEAMGCVLGQHDESGKREQAIYYLSKKFTAYEANYSFLERSCCALAWAVQKLRHYLLSHTTYLISRSDPLKYLLGKPMPTGRMAKWQMILSEFDIIFTTQKAIKGQAVADHLAENPLKDDYQPLHTYFPDEEALFVGIAEDMNDQCPEWRLFFDGASNSFGAGIGAVLVSPEGKHYPGSAKLRFSCTNNMAEYETCIFGLKMALEMEIKDLLVFSDSDLLVHQTLKEWITRDSKILPYHCNLLELANKFRSLEFRHIPRVRNVFADALATLSSMIQHPDELIIEPIQIHLQGKPAHCLVVEKSSDGRPWYNDIKEFLKTGSYPSGADMTAKSFLRRLSSKFFLNGEVVYRRTSDLGLLRCVDEDEAEYLMKEVHSGVCGSHMNGHLLAKKIMRTGYFWLTMEHDCIVFVRKCIKCQLHGDVMHTPPTELHSMTAPWPCSMWGMDVIGAIDPPASNGHRFILVAIEYFTKWVEAESYKHVTKKVVTDFLRKNIICRFGVPETLITDNAKNLNNDMVDGLCAQFKIKHRNSSIYRPQMNGAVEAANKNLKKIIRKMIERHRDWHEKLPYALMAYRTVIRTSTGTTPYNLMYGMEAVLPAEVEIPSLRILMEAKLEEAEWIQQRHEQLSLIDEKRLNAICHGQCYQKRVARAYNKRVRPRVFTEGDKVLKHILPAQEEAKGKFAPNWQGPFIVRKVLPGGALILAEMDGQVFPQPINSDMCKKFFI
ncbi:uncharacterized protein [Coffea arabica]|uniref:Uncharacterized protein n=1 Tax=Coffea arabica TaxID=13443 RepID=A0ABM4UQX0_COFAR